MRPFNGKASTVLHTPRRKKFYKTVILCASEDNDFAYERPRKIKFYITGSDFFLLYYNQPVLAHIKRYMVDYSLINNNSLKLVQTVQRALNKGRSFLSLWFPGYVFFIRQ